MKEYTILAVISVVIVLIFDSLLKTGLARRKEFYLFLAVIFGFKLLVNGLLTGKEIVLYNPRFFLGMRLGSIPLEDFLFGFSMVTLTIALWEYFRRQDK